LAEPHRGLVRPLEAERVAQTHDAQDLSRRAPDHRVAVPRDFGAHVLRSRRVRVGLAVRSTTWLRPTSSGSRPSTRVPSRLADVHQRDRGRRARRQPPPASGRPAIGRPIEDRYRHGSTPIVIKASWVTSTWRSHPDTYAESTTPRSSKPSISDPRACFRPDTRAAAGGALPSCCVTRVPCREGARASGGSAWGLFRRD
jgi:hypothetical protein